MFNDPLNRLPNGYPVVGLFTIEALVDNPGHPGFTEAQRIVVAALAERHPI
jgi:hypothetical protein